jgi:hypothetical protein
MQATSADVRAIMNLIRLEDDSEETVSIIRNYVGAAEVYLQNAGIAPVYSNDLYLDLVAQYVGIKYDAPEGVGGAALFNPTFIGQVEQVRLALQEAGET